MSKDEAHPGAGDIEIELGGKKHVLRPTLHAALQLSRQANGLVGLIRRLENLDMDTITMVIAHGLNYSGMGPKELPKQIFEAGLNKCAALAINYVSHLTNAGKPIIERTEEGEEIPLESELPMKNSTDS